MIFEYQHAGIHAEYEMLCKAIGFTIPKPAIMEECIDGDMTSNSITTEECEEKECSDCGRIVSIRYPHGCRAKKDQI